MHSRQGGGVGAVHSSCSFICCLGMWTETTRFGKYSQESDHMMKPRGERYYGRKDSGLQVTASEQK